MPHPLGRHVEHDPRSLQYQVAPRLDTIPKLWTRRCPILDQKKLGMCTGAAAAGLLGTDCSTVKGKASIRIKDALALYELATTLDSVDGSYPPDDTGSTGLAVAKACVQKALIKSYRHATSMAQLDAALMDGPVIIGIPWYEGMFDPINPKGLVKISGAVAGGHELCLNGLDTTTDEYVFAQSWGVSWGDKGYGRFDRATLTRLLKEQGDVTQLVR